MLLSKMKAQERQNAEVARNLTRGCSRPEIAGLSSVNLEAWWVVCRSADPRRYVCASHRLNIDSRRSSVDELRRGMNHLEVA